MRVLVIGNPVVAPALRALGHDVRDAFTDHADRCAPGVPFDVAALVATTGAPDLVLVVDTLGPQALPAGLEHVRAPRVLWAIDAHVNLFWQRHFARCFDLVLVAQRDYVPLIAAEGVPARWLPWGTDTTVFHDPGYERVHDVAFVGCVDPVQRPKRSAILARLAAHFDCAVFAAHGAHRLGLAETAAIYQRARIVVAESILGDLTFRVFEGMGCGALVLAEHVGNGLTTLYTPGEHLDVFGPDDLEAKAAWWLGHEPERRRVAGAGAALVAARHDLRHRMAEVVALVQGGIVRRDTRGSGARDWALAAHLATVRGLLHAGTTFPLAARALAGAVSAGSDPDAATALAEIVAAGGRPDEARRLLAHAAAATPDDPRPALLAAELARMDGDDAAAALLLRQAIAGAGGVDDALRATALAGVTAGIDGPDCAQAIGDLLAARGHPIVPGLLSAQGVSAPRSAYDWWLRAAERGARGAACRASDVLCWIGFPDAAVPLLAAALASAPDDVDLRRRLAAALRAGYRDGEAAHHEAVLAALAAEPLTGTPPVPGRALREAGVALLQAGAPARALAALDAAAALLPDDRTIVVDAALACIAGDDWAGARQRLERALAAAHETTDELRELLALVQARADQARCSETVPRPSPPGR